MERRGDRLPVAGTGVSTGVRQLLCGWRGWEDGLKEEEDDAAECGGGLYSMVLVDRVRLWRPRRDGPALGDSDVASLRLVEPHDVDGGGALLRRLTIGVVK